MIENLEDIQVDESEGIIVPLTEDEEEVLEDFEYQLEHEKYRFHEPTGSMDEFNQKVMSGKYFIVANFAANGVGKSTNLICLAAHLCYPCNQKYFQGKLWTNWPYPKKIRIISDPTTIKENLVPMIIDLFPKGRYETSKDGKSYISKITTDTGWIIDIMSTEQSPKEFESVTLGLLLCDEPPTEEIFKASVSRFRKGGLIVIGATPIAGSAWMYDKIVTALDNKEGKRTFVTSDVESACIEHGVRGFLKHEHIEQMISQYDEDDKQARIFGKFQHLSGLVFKKFIPDVHVIEPFEIDYNKYTVYEALDTHERNPDAVIWVAVDQYGTKYVIDELYHTGTISELATAIREKASKYRIARRICEPRAFVEDQHTGRSVASMLSEQGLSYIKATKMRDASNKRIKQAIDYKLAQNDDGSMRMDEFIRKPELYFFSDLGSSQDHYGTIYEMSHWKYVEYAGKAADKHGKSEKTEDKNDHFIECLGRILIQEPKYTPWDSTANLPTPKTDFDMYKK